MPNNFSQRERGVVILFAVLLVTVVLTISLGVFNITYRQLVLSSIARESEVAFAVADSARNCVMYWNSPERLSTQRSFGYYEYDFVNDVTVLQPGSGTITCGGVIQSFTPADVPEGGETFRTSSFTLKFDNLVDRPVCANVVVRKNINVSNQQTIIKVDGYNLSSSDPNNCVPQNLNRAVERTLETVING